MATSQAAPFGTAVAAIGETIVGSHMLKIDSFSATKDHGVGKSIKSSTFNVGGHGWYIECYPCGADEDSAGWVSIFLCLSVHKEQVEAGRCQFVVKDLDGWTLGGQGEINWEDTYNDADTLGRFCITNFKRADLEMELEDDCFQLEDDCFQIRCDVYLKKEFPAVLPPDLHQPLSLRDHIASGVHRGLPSTTAGISAENVAGSHVLTIDGYSKAKKAHRTGNDSLESEGFHVGGHDWYMELYPNGERDDDTHCLPIFLVSNGAAVKMEHLLGDSFHVKCDVTVVKEITPMRPPNQHLHLGHLLASQVGTDVEFEVGGDLFSAHKCILATRSTAFMAEFFGQARKSSSTTVTHVQIDDMEPRVFKALLHFVGIYMGLAQ